MNNINSSEISISQKRRSQIFASLVPLSGLVFVIALFGILTGGRIFSGKNLLSIINTGFPLILGAMGSIFLYAQGAIDLISASTYAFAAILAAYVSPISPVLSLLVCLAIPVGCALLNSILITKAKIALFIAQMSFQFAVTGILDPLSNHGSVPVPFSWTEWDSPWLKLIILVVLGVILFYLYQYTKLGKHARAIGASGTASAQSGINLKKMLTIGFVISGLIVGICAFLTLIRTGMASSVTGNQYQFNVMIALVLGGVPIEGGAGAKFHFAIIGALIIIMLSNGLTVLGLDKSLQQVVQAAVFIGVLILSDKLRKEA